MNHTRGEFFESERLKELDSYRILDTLSEKEYDDITFMASIICEVPIAMISFIDKDRQWFKSFRGVENAETSREYSFCAQAIQTSEPLVVPDSRIDERFKDNPFVTGDPNIVFYAGVPLITEDGYGLGTVCVIDNKPRVLTENQLKALEILSRQVTNLLKVRRLNVELQEITDSLEKENKNLTHDRTRLGLSLEKFIASRVTEIARQNNVLDKMNRELQAFTYITSHHLQEPLRKIQTFSSVLKETDGGKFSEKGRDYLSKIDKSALRLRSLIRDLLTYTHISSDNNTYREDNFSAMVADVKRELIEEIREKDAEIVIDSDCDVIVIPLQFRQLLSNLMANSLKFARREVKPVVRLACESKKGKEFPNQILAQETVYYRITVTDNGLGFDNLHKEKIFEMFQTTDEHYGTGIGLALVKKILDNHEGFIDAKCVPNVATTFTLYIPKQTKKIRSLARNAG